MADEARFYKKNFITKNNTNTAFTGAATIPRIFDRDIELKYQSVGSDQATQENIRSDFKSGGIALDRTFDTIIVLGHNLANFTLQEFDGTVHANLPGGVIVGASTSFTVITFAARTAKGFRILMDTVQDPGSQLQKQVGEILVLSTIFAMPTDDNFSDVNFSPIPSAVIGNKFDGGVQVNQLKFAGNRVERFAGRLDFILQSQANYDSLRSLFREPSFNAYLEPVTRPEEVFLVTAIPSPPSSEYASPFKGSGYNLSVLIREI